MDHGKQQSKQNLLSEDISKKALKKEFLYLHTFDGRYQHVPTHTRMPDCAHKSDICTSIQPARLMDVQLVDTQRVPACTN